ncbi:MAG: 3-hydroxybutyryl-CoA dehydrogenase [Desulfobacterales bacterium]|nr:3-hydroxybutyryl-CoA dehydrogenase [Desulfobacterales bacterium]
MSKPLEKVAVVGTGILGAQIAMLAVHAGYRVKIFDPREEAFIETYNKIQGDLKAKDMTPFIPWEDWEACEQAIQKTTELGEAVKDAELVIEAVPENLDLKRQVFRELGQKAPPGAILATNSSSMPVSKFEENSGRPERCLNIHFYFPLQGINMVDIMGGTKTLPEVMQKGIEWIRSIGCIPLTVKKEILGFCFNRVWRAIKREVLYMWGNGFVDFRDVDRAWMIFTGMKEGPFALMDKVGLDVIHDIEMVYYRDSNDPRDKPPDALLEVIKRGDLGVKSGKGFYTYPDPEFMRADFINPKG